MKNLTLWRDPNVSIIHLLDGQVGLAEVNGKNFEGTSGSACVQGRQIDVLLIAHTDEWQEIRPLTSEAEAERVKRESIEKEEQGETRLGFVEEKPQTHTRTCLIAFSIWR